MQLELICFKCKHYRKNLTCSAFEKKIPKDILEGRNNHSKPTEGQANKIVFEPKR